MKLVVATVWSQPTSGSNPDGQAGRW